MPQAVGLGTRDVIASPLLGPEGNREFLAHLAPGPGCAEIADRIATVTARMTVERIGFAYNPTIEAAVELSARAAGWCQMRKIDQWQAPSDDIDVLLRELPTTDALVVLGGDGTFLRAIRAVAEVDVPILGINLGKVGFLSKAEAGDLDAVLGSHPVRRVPDQRADGPRGRDPARRSPDRRHPARAPSTTSSSRVARLPASAGSTSPSTISHLATFIADGLVIVAARPAPRAIRSRPAARSSTRSAGTSSSRRSPRTSRPSGPSWSARARSSAVASSTPTRRSSRSTAARTSPSRVGDLVEVRAVERPIRLIEPTGAQPFWDLLRHKVALLPS